MHLKPSFSQISLLFCALLFATLTSSAQKVIDADTSHFATLRIDPMNAMGGTVSDFFDEVRYVPLETTNESIFGSINQLEVTDDYYIINDYNTKSILIFTKNGKFHAKIKNKGKYGIYSFSINRFTKQIIYYNSENNAITYCDFDGKMLQNIKWDELKKNETAASNLFFFSPDKAITNGYFNKLDTTDKYYKTFANSLIQYVVDSKTVYAKGLLFSKEEGHIQMISQGKGPLTAFGNDTTFFYSKPYAYSLYTITPNTIKLAYKFVFPASVSLPRDFYTNPEYNANRIGYFQKNTNQYFSLNNCYLSGYNLLFEVNAWNSYNSKENSLIYNLKSGTLIAYKHIQLDEKSYYLPIIDEAGYSSDNKKIIACTGKYLYTSISSLAMFKANENSADKNVKYTPELTEYFKKSSRRDNPVIIEMKLKNEL